MISIHALLAESDSQYCPKIMLIRLISIHALLAESDLNSSWISSIKKNFYPRSPCGERPEEVSGDTWTRDFYPRSPCGERLSILPIRKPGNVLFLSTLSLRRATGLTQTDLASRAISIHALLAESDSKSAQNSGALLRIWNKFYGDCIFMLTGKAVFYPFCPCFFHIFWCEGSGNFMIAFPSH